MSKGTDKVLPAPTISDPRKKVFGATHEGSHLRTHVTYPQVYVVVVGNMVEGVQFYGPFTHAKTAIKWAADNLKVGEGVQVYPMSHVRGMYGGLMSH